jgi:MFS family permease
MATLLNFAFLWCELGLSTFLVVFLTDVAGMSTGEAVLVSGASGLTGWFGQVLWGSLSDIMGRKKVLGILVTGWVVTVAPLWLISESWHAWVVLLAWGLFRNAPYPVIYALVIDSAPREAGASMGLIIALTTGLGGAISTAVTGWLLQSSGWVVAFLALVAGLVLGVVPLALVREPRASDGGYGDGDGEAAEAAVGGGVPTATLPAGGRA